MNIDLKQETGRYSSSRIIPYQYAINSWKVWCKKNNVELYVLTEPLFDINDMAICWQRYYIFDILEANNINYNQIAMIDADIIVHPNCPNFFEMSENKFCGVHADGSYDWILRSIENYSHFIFNKHIIQWWNYIDCGFMISNTHHKKFFKLITDFYWKHKNILKEVEKLHNGTDQTPVNFLIELNSIDLLLLPYEFNMIDMTRKEILTENLLFTKIGWLYHFNAIPNNVNNTLTNYWMEKTYKYLYEN